MVLNGNRFNIIERNSCYCSTMRQKDLDSIDEPIFGIHYGSNISKNHVVELPPGKDLNDTLETLCGQSGIRAKWLEKLSRHKQKDVTCGNCRRVLDSRA